jgi:hypothetical protein
MSNYGIAALRRLVIYAISRYQGLRGESGLQGQSFDFAAAPLEKKRDTSTSRSHKLRNLSFSGNRN